MALKCFWPIYHFSNEIKEVRIEPLHWGRTNASNYSGIPEKGLSRGDVAARDYLVCCESLKSFETPNSCKNINAFLMSGDKTNISETRAAISNKIKEALKFEAGLNDIREYRLVRITFKNLDTPESKKRCEYCNSEKTGDELQKFNNFKNEFWNLFCGDPTPDVPASPEAPSPPPSTPIASPVPPPKPQIEIKKIPLAQLDNITNPCNNKLEKIVIQSTENQDIRFLVNIETLKSELSKKIAESKDLLDNISKQVLDSKGSIKNINFKTLTEEYLPKTPVAERKFYSFPENEKIDLLDNDPAKKVLLDSEDIEKIMFPDNKSPTAEKGDLPLQNAQRVIITLKEPKPDKHYNSDPKTKPSEPNTPTKLILGKNKATDYALQLFNGERYGKINSFYQIELQNNFFVTIPIKFSIDIKPRMQGSLSFTLKCKNKDKLIEEGDSCWDSYNAYGEKTKIIQFAQSSISLTSLNLSLNIILKYNLNIDKDDKLKKSSYVFPNSNILGIGPNKYNHNNKAGDKVVVGTYLFPAGTSDDVVTGVSKQLTQQKIIHTILENTTTKFKSIILKGGNDSDAQPVNGVQAQVSSKIQTITDIKGEYITDFTNGTNSIEQQLKANLIDKDKFVLSIQGDKIIIFDVPLGDKKSTNLFEKMGDDTNQVFDEILNIITQKVSIPGMDSCCCCYYELDSVQNNIKGAFDIIVKK